MERLQISSLLSQGSYESAVSAAVSLVDQDPSADNRLLLAETVGESAYNGVTLNAWDFAPAEGDGEEDTSADEERQACLLYTSPGFQPVRPAGQRFIY